MRQLILICLCSWQILQGQVPYFNVQFDYDNRLETAALSSIETDSFYIIPIKGASQFQSVADTSFVLKINKFTGGTNYKKISYYEGQSVRNILIKNNRLFINGSNYNAPKEYIVDNSQYISLVSVQSFDTILLKNFGLPDRYDSFYRPILTSDGGIFSSGWSFPANPQGNSSLLFFKCDSNLNQLFLKIIPSTVELNKNYLAGGVVETPDKGFLIVGTKHIVLGFFANALVVKVDSAGNQVFWKEIPHSGDTTELYLVGIAKNGNANYIAVGQRIFNPQVGPGWERSWVVGLDAQGNVLWSKSYAENERSGWASIEASQDGNFYACGYERDFADAIYKQYATISKLAPNGDLIWHRKYSVEPSGKHYDIFFNILVTSDGGILCNGTTYGNDTTRQNAWIVKLDSLGCLSPGCDTGVDVFELPIGNATPFILAPNPTSGVFQIQAKNDLIIDAVRVYAMGGALVYNAPNVKSNYVSIELNGMSNGPYVCSVLINGTRYIRQIMLLK